MDAKDAVVKISASDEVPGSVSIKDGRNEAYSYGIGLGEAITRS
jgi:hypothetical protein